VKSEISQDFLDAYRKLPREVRELARTSYRRFRENPNHPGLHFKRLQGTDLYSVRIGLSYRALGTMTGDTMTWFWIGSHADYDKLVGLS
jgi:phosphoketolase